MKPFAATAAKDEAADDALECRYCQESGGILIRPCACTGSIGVVHPQCLQNWLNVKSPRSVGTLLLIL